MNAIPIIHSKPLFLKSDIIKNAGICTRNLNKILRLDNMQLRWNHNAMEILEKLEQTPQTDYMKAVLYSRFGDGRNAVQHYMNACSADRSFVFRGSLDPEIATLIKHYNLNLYDQ